MRVARMRVWKGFWRGRLAAAFLHVGGGRSKGVECKQIGKRERAEELGWRRTNTDTLLLLLLLLLL